MPTSSAGSPITRRLPPTACGACPTRWPRSGATASSARAEQWELGNLVRDALARRGFASVAAPGFEAPGVVVSYTDDPDIHNGRKFAAQGLQTAAGVPLQCDEPTDFRSFRIGLFGLDKLQNVERTVASLEHALDAIG